MINLVHLLIQAKHNNLPDVVRDLNKFVSQHITRATEANERESCKRWMLWLFKQVDKDIKEAGYRFWQPNNHAALCFSSSFAWQKLVYVHNNPVQAGMVAKAEEYTRSSAADYYFGKQKSKVAIPMLDAMIKAVG